MCCASKPWDAIRETAPAVKGKIKSGSFRTSYGCANVKFRVSTSGREVLLHTAGTSTDIYGRVVGAPEQRFYVRDLRELATFLNEIADQCEGK